MPINVKMPTIVDILTFISMINTTSERLKARNGLGPEVKNFFHAQLSLARNLSWWCNFLRNMDSPNGWKIVRILIRSLLIKPADLDLYYFQINSLMGNNPSPESQQYIFYNAQRQVTLNLKQPSGLNSNTRYYASSAYLQVLKRSELKWPRKPGKTIFSDNS